MINTFKYKKLTWVDLESPTKEEVKELIKKYGIHPLVADELLKPTLRPKVDAYPKNAYLVLHFPIFDYSRNGCTSCEIDFVVEKDLIITAHYQTIGFLHELTKIFEADAMLKEYGLTKDAGMLFFNIIKQFYFSSTRQLEHIQEKISDVEDKMFSGAEYDLVQQISLIRRDLIEFRRIIHSHQEIFVSFEPHAKKLFGKEFTHYYNSIMGEYYKAWNMLESFNETIISLQDTTDSLLNHRSNEIMKNLTIMASVTFPLALFASLFGMNTVNTPIIGLSGDFWIISGFMTLATMCMFIYFKRKKWL